MVDAVVFFLPFFCCFAERGPVILSAKREGSAFHLARTPGYASFPLGKLFMK
jgi:hypothetical protein